MPAVNPNPDNHLRDTVRKILDRLRALETQQNGGVKDKNGIQRIIVGLLPSGDFGILVADAAGVSNEILPTYFAQDTATLFASANTTNVDLGFPALTVQVGASGKVQVTVSTFVELGSGAGVPGGFVGVSIDGNTPSGVLAGCCGLECANSSAVQGSQSVTLLASGITPGSHTFKCLFSAQTGGANFLNTYLRVEPL